MNVISIESLVVDNDIVKSVNRVIDGNITDRSDANDWAMSGGKPTLDRAQSMIDECLTEYKGPHIPEDARQKLNDIIKNRLKFCDS